MARMTEKKNKTKIKNNIFFHHEKFLDERSEYRFLNIYIYIYIYMYLKFLNRISPAGTSSGDI